MPTKLKLALVSALALALGSAAATADTLNFAVSNKTSEAIKSIKAVPRAGGKEIDISSEAIDVGATSPVTLAAPASTCVFNLTIKLASGRVISKADTFLCHIETLVVQ